MNSIANNNYREKMKKKLDDMRAYVEDETNPLYKREQMVFKAHELKRKLYPRKWWNSSENGTYRKRISK